MSSPPVTWHNLPTEMKLQILDLLPIDQVNVLSKVDSSTYSLCTPFIFREVSLHNFDALSKFLDHVPPYYHRYIRSLSICAKPFSRSSRGVGRAQTTLIEKILLLSTSVERLTLQMYGSPTKDVIPCFERLTSLKSLHLSNCADDRSMPLSERLVVSIALTVPYLEELSLDQVARSSMHAPDLIGSYPYVPVVTGDEDIGDHPMVGSTLCLPSLLRIPTLRTLRIKNTHIGDPLWEITPCLSGLANVDLGSCCYVLPKDSQLHVERIMNNVGKSCDIEELAINTNLENVIFKHSLPHLKNLCLTPFFPVDEIVDTLTKLAESPIETLNVQCYEDDLSDLCISLEEFLSLRVERGFKDFYGQLKEISVSLVTIEGEAISVAQPTDLSIPFSCVSSAEAEHISTIRRFCEYCRDLGIEAAVDSVNPYNGSCVIRLGGELMADVDQVTGSEMNASLDTCL